MARFRGQAMDWTLHEVTDDHAAMRSARGVGPYLELVRTPDTKSAWNRVHLDVCPCPEGRVRPVFRCGANAEQDGERAGDGAAPLGAHDAMACVE